jgi:hypothetical protein
LLAPLIDALRQLWVLVQVHADRSRLALARSRQLALERLAVKGLCVLLALAGTVFLALGVRGGFLALFAERPWLAELATGALLIGVSLAWSRGARKRVERTERRRLAAKYATLEGRRKKHGEPQAGRDPGAPAASGAPGAEPPRG